LIILFFNLEYFYTNTNIILSIVYTNANPYDNLVI